MIVVADDSEFTARSRGASLRVTFTRSSPATDIGGIGPFVHQKRRGCTGPNSIDARVKPHHAPPLEDDPKIDARGSSPRARSSGRFTG